MGIFDEFFSGFRAKFQKIVTCVAFSIKFAKTNQKFAENSEFCEKNSLLLVNYSLHSLEETFAANPLRALFLFGNAAGAGAPALARFAEEGAEVYLERFGTELS